ncbi:MAG: 23S rRNA (adenine(2030)-N(6))-methyltransferase RlmJ [Methylobacteriaceae bacterium]|nr:23S rRNA (adenine(2030)-N(6))-methyltransferase RlmJ [Methylobacteriaceae bacterium]
MNYRHAYHAGNFADVMKHALLSRILDYLKRKEKPFRVIDTHAGIGLYDLEGDEAKRTGEAANGIARLDEPFSTEIEQLLAPYRHVLAEVRRRFGPNIYPGSPALTRELLRPQDRGVFVELHPEDYETLSSRFNAVTNTKVLNLDGWIALTALIPPKEKRGLVLVDPPFEATDELDRMVREIAKAARKWRTGIYTAWYPVKERAPADAAWETLKAACDRPLLRAELMMQRPKDPAKLNGCGLFVINPPWVLAREAEMLLSALVERLAGKNGSSRVEERE